MYELVPTPTFETSLTKVGTATARLIIKKLEVFAREPYGHAPLRHLPKGLKGLQKYRVGDWRVIFWMDEPKKRIVLFNGALESRLIGFELYPASRKQRPA